MTGISVSAEPEAESEVEIFDTLLADLKNFHQVPIHHQYSSYWKDGEPLYQKAAFQLVSKKHYLSFS